MNRLLNVAVALVIVLLLLGYMMTYTVRFNQAAVVTTFGSATERSVVNAPAEGGEPGSEAGLHFKWPWPVQQVARTYDTRVQVLESVLEQTSTSDAQTAIVQTFVAWRVADPLAFYKTLGSVEQAENALRNRLRDSNGIVGNYTFNELTERENLREASSRIKQRVADQLAGYGVVVEEVGIKRVVLPAAVTERVFERMRAEREALAAGARSEGATLRQTLVTEAETDAQRISSFASRRAANIVAEGQQRANQILAQFQEDAQFAKFLIELDALRQILGNRSQFVLDADFYPLGLLKGDGSGGAGTMQVDPPQSRQQDQASAPAATSTGDAARTAAAAQETE